LAFEGHGEDWGGEGGGGEGEEGEEVGGVHL
jgi:hypothetical protein